METRFIPALTWMLALGNLDSFLCGEKSGWCGWLLPREFSAERADRTHESHRSGQNQRARRGVAQEIGSEHCFDDEGDDRSGTYRCRCADRSQRNPCEQRTARKSAQAA